MLINQGYPEAAVHRFFAPLAEKNVDVVDKKEESRRFYAYLNRNGTLHNNGMVATAAFMPRLEQELRPSELSPRQRRRPRPTSCSSSRTAASELPVGVRKLGMAHLKGLEKLAVYEIVDAPASRRRP